MVLLEPEVFWTPWRNVVREMLIMSCSSYVCNCSPLLFTAYTTPTRHALSANLLDAEFRVQVKVRQIKEKGDCIAIISDGWSNVREQGIFKYIISTPQPVFYKSTYTRDNIHTCLYIADVGSHLWPWTTEGICTGVRLCCEHEGCLV